MAERKSHKREFKFIQSHTRVTLENGKNISSASRKFNMDRKRIRECLKQEESIVNQKRRGRSNGSGGTLRFPLMNKHCTMIFKKHGIKRKQSNVAV